MIALERFAKSWWGALVTMVILIIAEVCVADYLEYPPDEWADSPLQSPIRGGGQLDRRPWACRFHSHRFGNNGRERTLIGLAVVGPDPEVPGCLRPVC